MGCVFCKILKGKIPSKPIYEDENVFAFFDINPQAPVHVLFIPKIHIDSANLVTEENSHYIKSIFEAIPKAAKQLDISSYRIITNCGKDAGQTVEHLHFHLLAGVQMQEGLLK